MQKRASADPQQIRSHEQGMHFKYAKALQFRACSHKIIQNIPDLSGCCVEHMENASNLNLVIRLFPDVTDMCYFPANITTHAAANNEDIAAHTMV